MQTTKAKVWNLAKQHELDDFIAKVAKTFPDALEIVHVQTCIAVSTNGPQIAYLQSFSGWEEDYGREVTIANANLISAAPELLSELIKVRKIIEYSDEWWIDSPDRGGFDTESIDAAINKALGK
jgi:hypothetical protein